jgi:hypothetical protein
MSKTTIIDKKLILESISDTEKHRLLMQNFINNVNPKDQAEEMHKIAAINSGVVDGETKQQLININQKTKSLGSNHFSALDREKNGVDVNDLKMHNYASKSLI